MSLALGHFALGATVTALLVTYLLPTLPYPRSVVLAGGGWALVPDVAKLAPTSPKLVAFHDSQWADLFWFHGALDRFDMSDSPRTSALLVVVLLLVTLLTERRDNRALTRVRDTYEDVERSTR